MKKGDGRDEDKKVKKTEIRKATQRLGN